MDEIVRDVFMTSCCDARQISVGCEIPGQLLMSLDYQFQFSFTRWEDCEVEIHPLIPPVQCVKMWYEDMPLPITIWGRTRTIFLMIIKDYEL